MRKCVVVADAVCLVVGKDSVVIVSEQQYELARHTLKPLEEKVEPKVEEEIKEKKKTSKKKDK